MKKVISKPRWSRHAVIKYALLQLIELTLILSALIIVRQWYSFPLWVVVLAASLIIVKDVIMFPYIWRAYDKADPNSMIGAEATVTDKLSPSGYVRIQGALWRATVIDKGHVIEEGETVTVMKMDGLTLHVKPGRR